jgi:hypothetical protein
VCRMCNREDYDELKINNKYSMLEATDSGHFSIFHQNRSA